MKQPRLERLYDQLTSGERVTLLFAALGRNDEREADRLWSSLPIVALRGPAPEFTRRFAVSLQILTIATADLESLIARLVLLEAIADLAEFAAGSSAEAAVHTVWTETAATETLMASVFAETQTAARWLPAVLGRIRGTVAVEFANRTHGWDRVIREQIGIGLADAIAAVDPDLHRVTVAALSCDHDPAVADAIADHYSQICARLLNDDPDDGPLR